jgi:AcrR family transcriptional regulator
LLDTATELFYERGIGATGVDTVVAAARVSKPTLYAHFGSKSELVAAVLERRHERRMASLQAALAARAEDPRGRLLAVFDWLADWYVAEGPRGCAFLNAAAELPNPQDPGREVARRQKRWTRDYLAGLARQAGLAEPDRLSSQLLLLMDGASSRIAVEGAPGAVEEVARQAAGDAKAAAMLLLTVAAQPGAGAMSVPR